MEIHATYALTDPRDGCIRYLGKTSREDPTERPKEHLQPGELRKHTHKNHWINELLSLGLKPNLEFIGECDSNEEVNQAEIVLIAYLKSLGANLTNGTPGGDGRTKGSVTSEETKRKMSLARKGKKKPPRSPEHIAKLTAANIGKVISPETRQKISTFNKGRPKGGEKTARPVIHVETGIQYRSGREAAKALGVKNSHVFAVCNGDYLQCNGHSFRWVEERRPPLSMRINLMKEVA